MIAGEQLISIFGKNSEEQKFLNCLTPNSTFLSPHLKFRQFTNNTHKRDKKYTRMRHIITRECFNLGTNWAWGLVPHKQAGLVEQQKPQYRIRLHEQHIINSPHCGFRPFHTWHMTVIQQLMKGHDRFHNPPITDFRCIVYAQEFITIRVFNCHRVSTTTTLAV